MIHEDFPIQIDLSIVRQSSKEAVNLKEANILNSNGKYEIEIEVINNKVDDTYTNEQLHNIFKKINKYILSGLQGTNYPISYKEQSEMLVQIFKNV